MDGGSLVDAPIYYAPTLAVHYAKALVPSLYTTRGAHPAEIAPQFAYLDVEDLRHYLPVSLPILRAVAAGELPSDTPPYARAWPRDFDYLYLVGPRSENPIPDLLVEIAAGERFALYRIKRSWGTTGFRALKPTKTER